MTEIISVNDCTSPKGYDPVFDPESNSYVLCNACTGEIVDATLALCPVGTRITTPRELQRRAEKAEERKAAEERKEVKKYWLRKQQELGNYCFVISKRAFDDIRPETLVRLVYLSTYADYDTGVLMRTARSAMLKTELTEVLRVSESTVRRFLTEANKYLTVNDDGTMRVERPYFRKGTLRGTEYVIYQKVFIDAVRRLYKACSAGDHKRLGYVFQMLPYVSVEYNMLCHNPDEVELDKVEPMSVREFCEKIGYDYSDIARLRKEYARIKFPVGGHEENFFAFVSDGNDIGLARIFVNPHILFSGLDYKSVNILGKFCEPKPARHF